jgi:hypothetical protein
MDYWISRMLDHRFSGLWCAFGWVLNQVLQDFEGCCRGELHSPSHDTDAFSDFGINIVSLMKLKSIS